MEFLRRVKVHYRRMGEPLGFPIKETEHELILPNSARIIALPENERTIRVFQGVDLLVIDEASRVDDDLYHAVTPMLGTSGGSLIALTTAFGQRGWFFDAWQKGGDAWQRIKITALQSSRFAPGFLDNERRSMPLRDFEREYLCVFHEAEGSVFRPEDIEAAFDTDREPFFGGSD